MRSFSKNSQIGSARTESTCVVPPTTTTKFWQQPKRLRGITLRPSGIAPQDKDEAYRQAHPPFAALREQLQASFHVPPLWVVFPSLPRGELYTVIVGRTMPRQASATTTNNAVATTGNSTSRRRRLPKRSWLWWKPSVGPNDDRVKSGTAGTIQRRRASSNRTVPVEEDEDLSSHSTDNFAPDHDENMCSGMDDTTANSSSLLAPFASEDDPPPQRLATPQQWIEHYQSQLQQQVRQDDSKDGWTERANLYYKLGNLHAQCLNYEAATHAFEQEAHILSVQEGIPQTALVPIYKSLAKLWEVRQPPKALHYYQTALQYATTASPQAAADEVEGIRHAMGRLYFQTGNLERAMQISIGQLK